MHLHGGVFRPHCLAFVSQQTDLRGCEDFCSLSGDSDLAGNENPSGIVGFFRMLRASAAVTFPWWRAT